MSYQQHLVSQKEHLLEEIRNNTSFILNKLQTPDSLMKIFYMHPSYQYTFFIFSPTVNNQFYLLLLLDILQ